MQKHHWSHQQTHWTEVTELEDRHAENKGWKERTQHQRPVNSTQ